MNAPLVDLPCGHRAPRDPERADWCSECERLAAAEDRFADSTDAEIYWTLVGSRSRGELLDGRPVEVCVDEHLRTWPLCAELNSFERRTVRDALIRHCREG